MSREQVADHPVANWRRVAAAATLGLLVGGSHPASSSSQEVAPDTPPDMNTLVFVVDDMDDFSCAETKKYLPKSAPWLTDAQGRCYENASVTTPVCCPARAEIQSGRVPHNNKVERQIDSGKFNSSRSIQHYMGSLGLTTFGKGKLFNGELSAARATSGEKYSGFQLRDFWNTENYYDYSLHDANGTPYKQSPPVHVTTYAGEKTLQTIRELDQADQPFYGYVGFAAPHTQNKKNKGFLIPEPTPANAHRPVPKFRFKPESKADDKLLPFHSLDKGVNKKYLKKFNAARVRSLYGVDDQMAAAFRQLEADGELDNTAVFFLSDNGYGIHGENNWVGKGAPYPASYNVPLYARLPTQFGKGGVDKRPVLLADIAPTIYDMYDITPAYEVDGHSLLTGFKRREAYHEYRNERSKLVLDESGHSYFDIPTWRSFSTKSGDTYIVFYDPKMRPIRREFYDGKDEHMTRNLLAPEFSSRRPSDAKLKRMQKKLAAYADCAGTVEQGSANPCT